ncbi:MAG: hypothetical protein QM496_11880 [Verrucomicrobiota bacterium]
MSQVLNIRFSKDAVEMLEEFIDGWNTIGTSKLINEHFYELNYDDQSDSLSIGLEEDSSLLIQGYTTDISWGYIEQFSKSNNGEISCEGAPLADERELTESKLSFFGAIISIGGLIVLVVLWPFMLIYALLRLLFTIVISRK